MAHFLGLRRIQEALGPGSFVSPCVEYALCKPMQMQSSGPHAAEVLWTLFNIIQLFPLGRACGERFFRVSGWLLEVKDKLYLKGNSSLRQGFVALKVSFSIFM